MRNFSGAGRRPGIGAVGPTFVSAPGETLGPDRSRAPYPEDSRFWISSARWAQRAVNAWRSAAPARGQLIEVDNVAGPITIAALRQIDSDASNYPLGQNNTDKVLITRSVAEMLADLTPVRDPAPTADAPSDAAPMLDVPASVSATRSVYSTWLKVAFALGLFSLLGAAVFWYWRTQASAPRRRGARGLAGDDEVIALGRAPKPIPAKGDPRGHIAASTSSLRGLRRGRSRRRTKAPAEA